MPSPIVNRRIVDPGYLFSGEALNYFKRVAIASQPSYWYKVIMDKYLFRPLVKAGIFYELDRLFVFAGENATHSGRSIVNPNSTLCSAVNLPVYTALQGYTSNGGTSYVSTNFKPGSQAIKYTQNNACMFYYSRTSRAGNSTSAIGVSDTGSGASASISARYVGDLAYCNLNSDSTTIGGITNVKTSGLISINRTTDIKVELFVDGVSMGTEADTTLPLIDDFVFVCCQNVDGLAQYFTMDQISIAGMGSGNFDQAMLYSILQGLMIQLGTQV